jgi:hypothetical protein
MVLGYTGAGKTQIALQYLARFPRSVVDGQTIVPVLYAVMPDKPTRRSIVEAMLKALGDPAYDRGPSADHLTYRLSKLLKKCRTRVILIDEFQHVLDRAHKNVAPEAAEWLKTFWYANKIGVVLFGLDHSFEFFVRKENKQLRRRFRAPITLNPIPWKDDPEGVGVTYGLFLLDLDQAQPFPNFGMADPEFAMRMWLATKGHVARTSAILMGAVEVAVERGATKLEIGDFVEGFDRYVHTYAEDRNDPEMPTDNPFRSLGSDWSPSIAA